MKELKHQPCKHDYRSLFARRRTEREGKTVYCYGIVDMATDEVIPECKGCDEWELNAVDYEVERREE